jgi:soluble cytochrome b562
MLGGLTRLLAGALLLMGITVVPALAEEPKKPAFSLDRDSVQSRIENVRRLVNTSSGAQRVAQGSNEARSLRDQAVRDLAHAEQSFAAGEMARAHESLQKATMAMFQAIRKVGTGKVGQDKLLQDYRNKRGSLDALLEALERVAAEKGSDAGGAFRIRAQAAEADKLADAGRLKEARASLDQTYDAVKVEVERLRSGDTLVRTLEFASKEEEYAYELDRNETHRMLVRLLLDEKNLDQGSQAQVDGYIAEAGRLRAEADQAAADGLHERGIQLLEASTKQLVRAIRRAGVYIPG